VRLVRTHTYAKALKRLTKLGASVADIARMEEAIASNPEIGDVVPGAGGLRKMRFGYGRSGKSGGGRTIYYALSDEVVFMITAYAKVDKSDLTAEETRLFRALIKELTNDPTNQTGA
jgi:hypothetical protein